MANRRDPVFLERQTYRRRRLIDAVRLLPVLGLVALVAPILGTGGDGRSTALTGIYLFAVWGVLIVAAALLTRRLSRGPGGAGLDPLEDPAARPPRGAGGERAP